MKLFARPKCFSEAMRSVTILNCLLGLRVFEYPRGHPRPILSMIYLLFVYCVYCNASLYMQAQYYKNSSLMKLEYVLYEILMYITIISVILKMLVGWWYTKKFKVCHKKIFEIDETLRQLGLSTNYNRIYFVITGTITFWFTICFIASIVGFISLNTRKDMFTSISIPLTYMYMLTVNVINVFEFYMIVKYIQIKFRSVNRLLYESLINSSVKQIKLGIFELKDYAKIINAEEQKYPSIKMIFRLHRRMQSPINVFMSKKQNPVVSQIESHFPSQFKKYFKNEFQNQPRRHNPAIIKCQERKHLLQIIKQVHLELCKISKIVCSILGMQIIWDIGIIILNLTETLYSLCIRSPYIMQLYKLGSLPLEEPLAIAIICFTNILEVVFLSRVCKNAADEGNKTIEIIHAIYGCDANADIQEEIQQFGIQILQSPVSYSVFGLTLDNRILTTILRIVTTYNVIMIQVSIALESDTIRTRS